VSGVRATHHDYEYRPGAATDPLPKRYRPRRPQATAYYGAIAEHLETMLATARARSAHGFGLPRHVEASFRRYLDCGIIERGFARVVCPSCHHEVLVPFSCKTRGLCPSCDGRRMADGAAHLVDRVLPACAAVRQWTLSFPRWLRIRLLRDPSLVSRVLRVFVHAVFGYHRRRARQRGVSDGHTGAVTAIQRAGSFANANLHFHTLVPEGVWFEVDDGTVTFHALPPPTDEEVDALTTRIVRRVARLLAMMDADADASDPPEVDDLAHAQTEAVEVPLPVRASRSSNTSSRHRAAFIDGFSLHANTVVDPADRAGLERVGRYLLRPLINAHRLALRPDGRVEYAFKRPDPTGRTSWLTDGPSWCRRLATLVPPPRTHTTRFHGVFGPAHRFRARIVPASAAIDPPSELTPVSIIRLARRLDWASLLRRVFGDDVTRCPGCGDHLRILAVLTDPDDTTAILEHLGLRSEIPPLAPARALPHQVDLDFGD
jgi:ribosomal protein S27E